METPDETILNSEIAKLDDMERGALFLALAMFRGFVSRTPVEQSPREQKRPYSYTSQTPEVNSQNNAAAEPVGIVPDYKFETLTNEKRESIRRSIVRRIWEPDLRAELVTRVIWLLDRGYLSTQQLTAIFEKAESEQRENNKPRWQTIGAEIRKIFESSGFVWTQTARTLEPRPEGFDEKKRIPRRVPITQLLDPDYNPEREDRTPAAFRAFHSNDAARAAVATTGGVK